MRPNSQSPDHRASLVVVTKFGLYVVEKVKCLIIAVESIYKPLHTPFLSLRILLHHELSLALSLFL